MERVLVWSALDSLLNLRCLSAVVAERHTNWSSDDFPLGLKYLHVKGARFSMPPLAKYTVDIFEYFLSKRDNLAALSLDMNSDWFKTWRCNS
jgi:hypothetical protein